MNRDRLLGLSHRWFRLLIRFYPPDFRDDMGQAVVEAYRDRARAAVTRGGLFMLAGVWIRALLDAMRNGIGEWFSPAASWRRAGNWRRDAEFATRRLLRAPASAAAIVATLTIGLGMFAIVYTVFHKVLVEPMPYKNPDDLYFVWRDYGKIIDLKRGWLGGPDVAELRSVGGVIEDAAPLSRQQATFAVGEGAEAAEIAVMATSPNLFELLGVSPALGRGFAPQEAGPGRPALIVLTHDLWTRYGADPSIIGRDVRLNGEPYTVIGVMPKDFRFMRHASLGPPLGADAYTTVTDNLAEMDLGGRYAGLIRARPGTPPQTVAAAVDAVGRALDARHFNNQGLKLYPTGMKEDLIAGIRPAIVVIGFAGLFLLLILMVNLATVLLARAAQREHEFAVSRALGASGATVFRGTLFEGALLGLLGGVAGALWAAWGTRTLVALAPLNLPRRDTIAVDWPLGATVVGVGALLGVLAAVVPAVWATRSSLGSLLASSAVRGGGGHGRMRRGMVVVQVALSLVLLTAGGLVVRSFERLLRADPGFRPEGLVTVRVPLPQQGFPDTTDVFAAQERIHESLAGIPGVTAVSAADALPLTASSQQVDITIPGAPGLTGDAQRDTPLVDLIAVRHGYIDAMGMRLLEGRTFDRRAPEGVTEAIVDRHLATHFFPSGSPLGAEIPYGEKVRLRIIGVVDQARLYNVHEDSRPQLYVRADQFSRRRPAFVLRTDRDPQSVIPDVRAALRRVDSRLALGEVVTMEEIARRAVSQQRVSAVLIAGFALGALILAAMGLYGVVAGSVTRRRHELAVRLALGADHPRVLRLVLGEGAKLVALGMLIGVPGVYVAGGLLQGVLVGVAPTDPVTLAAVTAGLGVVAMLACYAPARRVLRIEPAQALRES